MASSPAERRSKPTTFVRRLVDVSGSLKLTIPRPIIQSYNYERNEAVQVYAPNENSIVIERVNKR